MSQSVSVGFAPAVVPVISNGSAAAAEPQGEGLDLFATLLALLGAEPPAPSKSGAALSDAPVTVPPLPLPDLAAPGPDPETASDTSTLLKRLGDALIALDAALDAGRPPDPALEKQLGEQLDAIAAWLGITPPAAAAPAIAAMASAGGILPMQPPTPVAPPAAPDTPAQQPSGSTLAPAAPAGALLPSTPLDLASADPDVAPSPAPEATLTTMRPAAEAAGPLPESLHKLAKLVDDLAQRVEAQAPELAGKLEAFADRLLAGKLPPPIASALTAPADGEAATDPTIQRIIDALAAPRPAATPAPAPKPFVAPTLPLPSPLQASPSDEAPPRPVEAPPAEAPRPEPTASRAEPVGPRPDSPGAKPDPSEAHPEPVEARAPANGPAATRLDPSSVPTATPPLAAAIPPGGARAVHAAYQAPLQQLNLPQMAFEVVRQFEAGNSRFQIRLDPPELGRIDVKLDVDRSGTINARMVVERPETLDLMQRDQRALQQALQQAGLDSARTNLEFSLRQNPFAQQQSTGDDRNQQPGLVRRFRPRRRPARRHSVPIHALSRHGLGRRRQPVRLGAFSGKVADFSGSKTRQSQCSRRPRWPLPVSARRPPARCREPAPPSRRTSTPSCSCSPPS